ncbi:hypothetical protein [Azospirillum canadense]|uniref:hypothetical protein n=1 Tax=Azospirillum canadense TaxID=403962 RepID=UPI0022262757|nr:hypothetical protein [Azospirillum canadense]MCW2240747.1 hypothetical protein [Azospirillum canadense]
MTTTADVLYATPVALIGKHEWRLIVTPSTTLELVNGTWTQVPCRVTAYEYRRIGDTIWHPARHWPTYNHNDGCFAGLPRTLGPKVYDSHEAAIKAALNPLPPGAAPVTPPAQPFDLFAA